jgi:hypothetical protein
MDQLVCGAPKVESLEGQLTQARQALSVSQDELARAESQRRRAEHEVAALQLQAANARVRSAQAATNYYFWDAASPYVRLPKSVLADVRLRDASASRDGQPGGRRTFYDDGNLAEPLRQALGISDAEAAQVRDSYQEFSRQFAALAEANTLETNHPPASYSVGLPNSRTLFRGAFPENGTILRDALRDHWAALLGADRFEALWPHVQSDMDEAQSEFGALEKFETVYWGTRGLGLGQSYQRPEGERMSGRVVSTRSPDSIPAHLRRLLPEPMQEAAAPAALP